MFTLRWDCVFTVISLVLAIVYFILLLTSTIYSVKLLRLPYTKRRSQRVFLLFVILQCLLRCIYFLAWPIMIGASDSKECAISAEGAHDSLLMSMAGSVPSALFISAFSVNAWTFARIYHATLQMSGRSSNSTRYQSYQLAYRFQKRLARSVIAFLLFLNLAVYASLVTLHVAQFSLKHSDSEQNWLINNAEAIYFYTLTCCAFLVSFTFAVYGWLLYRGVQQSIDRSIDQSIDQPINQSINQTNEPFLTNSFDAVPFRLTDGRSSTSLTSSFSSLSLMSSTSSLNIQSNNQSSNRTNSLVKLAVVSTLCLFCFLVRVVLLPVLESVQNAQFSFSLLLLYLCLSEVLPLLLILYLFDPLKKHTNDQSNNNQSNDQSNDQSNNHTAVKNHWHDAINQTNNQSDQLWEDGYLPSQDDQWWPINYDPYQPNHKSINQSINHHDDLSQPNSPLFSLSSSSEIGSINQTNNQLLNQARSHSDLLSTSASGHLHSPPLHSANHSFNQTNNPSINHSLSPRPRAGLTYAQAFKIDLKTALMQND